MAERRALTIGALVALVLLGGLADRAGRGAPAVGPVVETGPTARPDTGGASTWYCPLANAQTSQPADGTIVIQNTQGSAVGGLLTLFPTSGAPVAIALRVPPRDRLAAHEADFLKTSIVAAVVELERGGMAVEQSVSGALGDATMPCATAASDHWYVAEGSTALNNTMILGLFNPFPDDAIVDLEFATDQGRTAPGAFQGIVVGGRSVVAVNIGEHVRRRDHVAVSATARRGRIVVSRGEARAQPRPGLFFSLAAPAPQRFWDFPDGVASEAVAERFHLYNPSTKAATVQLALTLDQGAAEPFDLKVPAGERLTFDPGAESRVPKGVGHASTVRSDVPIVVERSLDYVPPAPRLGVSNTLGATVTAMHWLLPQGAANEASEEWVVVHNLDGRATTVTLTAVTGGRRVALDGLTDIVIPAGQRRSFRLLDTVGRADLPLAVDATRPVVVEQVLTRAGRSGVSHSMAIPVGTH